MENIKSRGFSTLEDEEAICQFHYICETVGQLKKDNESTDAQIRDLQHVVEVMTNRIDDLEQHGRRDSMRIFGLSESTPCSSDEKVLRLC